MTEELVNRAIPLDDSEENKSEMTTEDREYRDFMDAGIAGEVEIDPGDEFCNEDKVYLQMKTSLRESTEELKKNRKKKKKNGVKEDSMLVKEENVKELKKTEEVNEEKNVKEQDEKKDVVSLAAMKENNIPPVAEGAKEAQGGGVRDGRFFENNTEPIVMDSSKTAEDVIGGEGAHQEKERDLNKQIGLGEGCAGTGEGAIVTTEMDKTSMMKMEIRMEQTNPLVLKVADSPARAGEDEERGGDRLNIEEYVQCKWNNEEINTSIDTFTQTQSEEISPEIVKKGAGAPVTLETTFCYEKVDPLEKEIKASVETMNCNDLILTNTSQNIVEDASVHKGEGDGQMVKLTKTSTNDTKEVVSTDDKVAETLIFGPGAEKKRVAQIFVEEKVKLDLQDRNRGRKVVAKTEIPKMAIPSIIKKKQSEQMAYVEPAIIKKYTEEMNAGMVARRRQKQEQISTTVCQQISFFPSGEQNDMNTGRFFENTAASGIHNTIYEGFFNMDIPFISPEPMTHVAKMKDIKKTSSTRSTAVRNKTSEVSSVFGEETLEKTNVDEAPIDGDDRNYSIHLKNASNMGYKSLNKRSFKADDLMDNFFPANCLKKTMNREAWNGQQAKKIATNDKQKYKGKDVISDIRLNQVGEFSHGGSFHVDPYAPFVEEQRQKVAVNAIPKRAVSIARGVTRQRKSLPVGDIPVKTSPITRSKSLKKENKEDKKRQSDNDDRDFEQVIHDLRSRSRGTPSKGRQDGVGRQAKMEAIKKIHEIQRDLPDEFGEYDWKPEKEKLEQLNKIHKELTKSTEQLLVEYSKKKRERDEAHQYISRNSLRSESKRSVEDGRRVSFKNDMNMDIKLEDDDDYDTPFDCPPKRRRVETEQKNSRAARARSNYSLRRDDQSEKNNRERAATPRRPTRATTCPSVTEAMKETEKKGKKHESRKIGRLLTSLEKTVKESVGLVESIMDHSKEASELQKVQLQTILAKLYDMKQ